MSDTNAYVPLSTLVEPYWPAMLGDYNAAALDAIYATPVDLVFDSSAAAASINTTLLFTDAYNLGMSLLPSVTFALGQSATETEVPLSVTVTDMTDSGGFALGMVIGPIPVTATIKSSLFKPVEYSNTDGVESWTAKDGTVTFELGSLSLSFDSDGNVDFDSAVALDVSDSPFMIADTDIVVASGTITPHVGPAETTKYLALDDLVVYLPAAISRSDGSRVQFTADNVIIGAGGLSGDLSVSNVPELNLFGMGFALDQASISIIQNTLASCSITGTLTLPFFSDGDGGDLSVTVAVSIGQDGALHVELSDLDDDGIAELDLPIGSGSKLRLSSIGFDSSDGGSVVLGGELALGTIGGTELPTVAISGLRIAADGTVTLPAGGITLQQQLAINLYGFTVTIDSFGIGTEELTDGTYNYVSLSGGINLPDPLPVGVSAKGLRIMWPSSGSFTADDVKFTIDGIGVELTIPEVLYFGGEVSLVDQELRGAVALYINAIDLLVDAELIIGQKTEGGTTYQYFYIDIDAELPVGIPLGATGLGLFGFRGLFIHNMVPTAVKSGDNQSADFDWYNDWYRPSPAGIDGSKFAAEYGGEGLGAGTTLGTMADNGYIFASKLALVLLIPGPIIMLTGTGNLLRTRSNLSDDPTQNLFDSLIVFDGTALNLLVALSMRYKLPSSDQGSDLDGIILNIQGSAEALYDFDDSSNWHVYLGTDTEPIRATILKLFSAESYLMLDNTSMRTGAKIGIDKSYGIDVASVFLKAILEGSGEIAWAPQHFAGSLTLDGELGVEVFDFEFGFTAHAGVTGSSPHDKELTIELEVSVNVPWPFDDITVSFGMSWHETHTPAPVSPVISEGGVVIADTKTSDTWTLTQRPDSSFNEGYFDATIPMDAHPILTFNRIVEDVPMAGIPQPIASYEEVNDNTAYKYSLDTLELHKWQDSSWQPVSVNGMWQANSDAGGTVLELYGNSPFGYMRQTGTGSSTGSDCPYAVTSPAVTLADSIIAKTTYPLRLNVDRLDFQGASDGQDLIATHYTPNSNVSLAAYDSRNRTTALVVKDNAPSGGQKGVTLNWPSSAYGTGGTDSKDKTHGNDTAPDKDKSAGVRLEMHFTSPIKAVSLQCYNPSPSETVYLDIDAIRSDGSHVYLTPSAKPLTGENIIALPDDFTDIKTLFVRSRENPARPASAGHLGQTYLEALTYSLMSDVDAYNHTVAAAGASVAVANDILESRTYYRLTVSTKTTERHSGSVYGPNQFYAYFKTDGPRDDLVPYVDNVALANNGFAHYSDYDIIVNTNENYIDKLYASLTMRLYTESEEELTATSGIAASWTANSHTLLPYYLSLWLDVCAEAGIGTGSSTLTTDTQNDSLYFRLGSQALPGGQTLVAKIFYGSTVIWSSRFATSRYANFSALVADINPALYTETAAGAADPDADFDSIVYDQLGIPHRGLPPRPDITAITDSAGAVKALLLCLPEPVDNARLDVTLAINGASVTAARYASTDGARHIFVPMATDGAASSFAAGTLTLNFTYKLTGEGLASLAQSGDSAAETAEFTINLP